MAKLVELKFLFRNGTERKYRIVPDVEPTDVTLRNSLGAIMTLFRENDFPLLTDEKGTVFMLPNASEILLVDARVIENGK